MAPKLINYIGFGGIHGPKLCKFIGFGDIHGPKPYEVIGFGDNHGPKPYKFKRFGDIYGPNPCEFIGFGATIISHTPMWLGCGQLKLESDVLGVQGAVARWVPRPYKFIGFGDIHGPKPYKSYRVW